MKRLLVCALLAVLLFGCKRVELLNDDNLLYGDDSLWYKLENAADSKECDIFYVLPTCIWDWSDSDGVVHYYANPYDQAQREAMLPSYQLAEDIFGHSANFYAPYYRQISLDSWMLGKDIVTERFPQAMSDVTSAFNYFIENYNNNKPFILAGFSQGGKAVVELLKQMPSQLYDRMVAAYVIGYCITQEELAGYPNIKPAQGEGDIGVVICYNSVEDSSGISSVLSPNSCCINPVSWSTETQPATIADTISVRVDDNYNVLFVEGLDSQSQYIKELDPLLPMGNYHLLELTMYQQFLKENVAQRVASFMAK